MTTEKEGMTFIPGRGVEWSGVLWISRKFLLENSFFSNLNVHMCHLIYC